MVSRVAIIVSHPIQYYVPWFRLLADRQDLVVKVYYLWTAGRNGIRDADFQRTVSWDLELLEGYDWEEVENRSNNPSPDHFRGLINPGLVPSLEIFDPDVLLLYGYKYKSHQFVLRSGKLANVPKLFRGDSHVLVSSGGPKEWLKSVVLKSVFRRYSGFLAVGKANEDYFRKYGVNRDRIFFAPHSVDNDRFIGAQKDAEVAASKFRRQLTIPCDALVFVFAGKFNTKKRPLDLLFAFLQSDLKEAHLVFVGSGELEEELRSVASENNRIHFLPFQNQTQMPGVYALGDLLVLPSMGSGETWGLCVNEAFCMKRPAIVSDHVGCQKDLVENEVTGLVFTAGDINELANRLRYCGKNPEKIWGWGSAAYQRIQTYSYQQTTDGLMRCLEAIRHL